VAPHLRFLKKHGVVLDVKSRIDRAMEPGRVELWRLSFRAGPGAASPG
jgi:hypothetical protein